MSKFLALIAAVAMALFIAGPAMAQTNGEPVVTKSVNTDSINDTTVKTNVAVDKRVGINIGGDLGVEGGLDVQGDVVFKELDVNVQDSEVVTKFFELDDSAHSSWSIRGSGVMNAAEQLQNGVGNFARIDQNPAGSTLAQMNVGLQYQIGGFSPLSGNPNVANITQGVEVNKQATNSFAKQIQIGGGNIAGTQQWVGNVPTFTPRP